MIKTDNMEEESKAGSQIFSESLLDSVHRYRRAVELGPDSAQYALGVCYECGIGVEVDEETSQYWYKEAAIFA